MSGDAQASAGVALSVDAGAVLALTGPNGEGNTTLVRLPTTALAPATGSAPLAGFDVVHVAIGSLANGPVDDAKSVILPVRTKRTDHRRAKSKSGDSSETRGKR
ncbi:MAG: ATP-binding cassette domain-containing protein [Solirubrobacteraceae bacterium]